MTVSGRRKFLTRSILATGTLATSPYLEGAIGRGADSPELTALRETLSRYSREIRVVEDSRQKVSLVCEIGDLSKFSENFSSLVSRGTAPRTEGNLLQFERNGRRIRIRHVWKP